MPFTPVTIQLENPVEFGKETIKEITFQRNIRGSDIKTLQLDKITAGDLLEIASSLTGQPPVVINKLEGGDLITVMQTTSGFLASGRATA